MQIFRRNRYVLVANFGEDHVNLVLVGQIYLGGELFLDPVGQIYSGGELVLDPVGQIYSGGELVLDTSSPPF